MSNKVTIDDISFTAVETSSSSSSSPLLRFISSPDFASDRVNLTHVESSASSIHCQYREQHSTDYSSSAPVLSSAGKRERPIDSTGSISDSRQSKTNKIDKQLDRQSSFSSTYSSSISSPRSSPLPCSPLLTIDDQILSQSSSDFAADLSPADPTRSQTIVNQTIIETPSNLVDKSVSSFYDSPPNSIASSSYFDEEDLIAGEKKKIVHSHLLLSHLSGYGRTTGSPCLSPSSSSSANRGRRIASDIYSTNSNPYSPVDNISDQRESHKLSLCPFEELSQDSIIDAEWSDKTTSLSQEDEEEETTHSADKHSLHHINQAEQSFDQLPASHLSDTVSITDESAILVVAGVSDSKKSDHTRDDEDICSLLASDTRLSTDRPVLSEHETDRSTSLVDESHTSDGLIKRPATPNAPRKSVASIYKSTRIKSQADCRVTGSPLSTSRGERRPVSRESGETMLMENLDTFSSVNLVTGGDTQGFSVSFDAYKCEEDPEDRASIKSNITDDSIQTINSSSDSDLISLHRPCNNNNNGNNNNGNNNSTSNISSAAMKRKNGSPSPVSMILTDHSSLIKRRDSNTGDAVVPSVGIIPIVNVNRSLSSDMDNYSPSDTLNTPVSTKADGPSFFPCIVTTIADPVPITGKSLALILTASVCFTYLSLCPLTSRGSQIIGSSHFFAFARTLTITLEVSKIH